MTRPLSGRRVVVTRPAGQARELVDGVRGLGGQVVELPLTEIVPVAAAAEIDAALDRLDGYDLIVVTSANGAACFAEWLSRSGRAPAAHTTIVAVGAATAQELRGHGLRVDVVPPIATGAAIVTALSSADLSGAHVLLPRARLGRPELPQGLRDAGARVDDVAFYDTRECEVDPQALAAALDADDVVLTAPSGARTFARHLGDDREALRLRVVTIGPTTSAEVRGLGLPVAAESAEQSVAGLLAALRSLPNVR